ncbi:MAG: hypothetical protein M1829_001578 [Trizodia sp. TS-e1964]|nr:MAG: hypothetical protein M1829_001578 [Trizodia sp. TS-e1964]
MLRSLLWLVVSGVGALYPGGVEDHSDGVKAIPLRTHIITPPYLDSDMQSRWFDFGGNTIIRADQFVVLSIKMPSDSLLIALRYIRLTSDAPSQQGWLFSRVPLTATNWEILVEFRISGAGSLHGDGLAMWLTKTRATQGPVFGSRDNFEGLGIFIDTYKNNRPGVVFPYVMAMMGDGKTRYDKANDGKDNELGGCSARGIRATDVTTKLRLTYFQEKSLKLELQYKDEDTWDFCFEVPNVVIPPVTYLGFSAETGELSDNHDIISVNTKNLYNPGGGSVGAKSGDRGDMGHSNKQSWDTSRTSSHEGGGWSWFFIKLVLFVLAIGGAYVGFTIWRTSQRNSRF